MTFQNPLLPMILAIGIALLGSPIAAAQTQASALLEANSHVGKASALDRPARFVVHRITLASALVELQRTSGVELVFSPSLLEGTELVSCSCADLSIGAVLERLLSGSGFYFTEDNGLIMIRPWKRPSGERRLQERPAIHLAAENAAVHLPIPNELAAPTALKNPLLQQSFVSGTVVDAQTLQLIAGAQIVVQGTQRGTLSDQRGRFRIDDLSGTQVTLEVHHIGYRTLTQVVRVGDAAVRLALTLDAVRLDEVVVTGTVGGTQRRAIGNAVGRVEVDRLLEAIPVTTNLQTLISPQVAGVRIMQTSGQIGGGGVTRIRGLGSLALGSEPLLIVDGVRVNNNSNDSGGEGGVGAFGRLSRPSRINDFSPNEIESIEIIKGPAAATLYGTEASNGVIQIITKRGRTGAAAFDLAVSRGANWLADPIGKFPAAYGRDPASGQVVRFHVLESEAAQGRSPFSTGDHQHYSLSMRGGTDAIRYFLAGDYLDDVGILNYNWQNKLSGRTNLTYLHGDKLEVAANLGAIRSRTRAADALLQSFVQHITWTDKINADNPTRGYWLATPEDYNEVEGLQDIDRTTASVMVTHRPHALLTHRMVVGGDVTNNFTRRLIPRHPLGAQGPHGTGSLGSRQVYDGRTTLITLDYSASIPLDLTPDLTATTSAGAQYNSTATEVRTASGSIFPAPGLETLSAAGQRNSGEDFVENKTFGLFIQEQLGWRNRLFLTGAIRGDDNSAFGTNYDFVVYPKFSGTWVVSEEQFLERVPFLSTLRLRTAWGKAGLQPSAFAAVRTYRPEIGPSGQPMLTPGNVGNPDLRPEVTSELELGFDASLWDDALTIEFTRYRKLTTDAIVQDRVAPSLGFAGTRFLNLGEVENRGFEFSIQARPVQRPVVIWDIGFKASHNENRVNRLAANFTGMEGYPIMSFFFLRVVSAELDANGNPINVMCEGGEEFVGGGPPVPCANAPRVYWGTPIPKWEGSVSSSVTLFQNLRLFGLIDFVQGHMMRNIDVLGSHHLFRNSEAIVRGDDPILVAYDRMGQTNQSGLMKAGFAKLRNVSATYSFNPNWAQRVGASGASLTLSGENLATLWVEQEESFGRRQLDPEMASNANAYDPIVRAILPQLTRFAATFRVSF